MNRKQAKRLLERALGDKAGVFARRVGGMCVLMVRITTGLWSQKKRTYVVGRAKEWQHALLQAKSGYMREVM